MSLFQVREWWQVKSEQDEEEYSFGAVAVGNVDNDHSGQVKIVTGSLDGFLRFYSPTSSGFKIEHLLLEEDLGMPILQVEIGYFVPNDTALSLAVLHPLQLSVYAVEAMGGQGAAANYHKLSLRYSHRLGIDGKHFTAYNFVYGPFGSPTPSSGTINGNRKDLLCIQSLDGRLQVFDQDRMAFLQPLNNHFLPGALYYVSALDSFVASTSDLQVECYRYQVLASASMRQKKSTYGESKDEESKSSTSTALHSDWKVNVGENVLQVCASQYLQTDATTPDIIVLCEFTLFVLDADGSMLMQKRLGFTPLAMTLFPRPMSKALRNESKAEISPQMHNLLIASNTNDWIVYQNSTIIWSACSSGSTSNESTEMNIALPLAILVNTFGNIPGMIVCLASDGALSVNYMGTDPPSSSVAAPDSKEINYEEMDEEHRQLLSVIRRSQTDRKTEPKERILLRVQVPPTVDGYRNEREEFESTKQDVDESIQVTIRVYMTFTGNSRVENVTLSTTTPSNIISDSPSIIIDAVDGRSSTPLIIPITLRAKPSWMPIGLDATISATYTLESGQPRVSKTTIKLPLGLACTLVPPVKISTYKFTLDTNYPPQELVNLFHDIFEQAASNRVKLDGSGSNVASFQYYNGVHATILVSKNAGRYRVQADELDALWMVSSELVARLQLACNNKPAIQTDDEGKNEDTTLQIIYQEPLPLADFFGAIDAHFDCRKEKQFLVAELNDRAHQLRVLQKRLLVRFKDRNPAPLNCLDTLLHGTYDQIMGLSKKIEQVEHQLKKTGNRLSCCVHLMLLLMRYRFNLGDEDMTVLKGYLSPYIDEDGGNSGESGSADQGWEERTDAALMELLRKNLSMGDEGVMNASNPGLALQDQELSVPKDTKRLKKHITFLCDRLGKGATLVPSAEAAPVI